MKVRHSWNRVPEGWWVLALTGGLLFSLLAVSELRTRADIAIDGVVVSSVLNRREPNRPVRKYVLRSLESGATFKYSAGPVDHALSQSIPNGARVIKKKGQLAYTVDGRRIDDFPTGFYSVALALAVPAFVAGAVAGIRRFRAYYRSL